MDFWCIIITVDVLLNCNHLIFNNYKKNLIRDGNTWKAHNSNEEKLRIFVCTSINIKKILSFTLG
jgi:hypothetical protein